MRKNLSVIFLLLLLVGGFGFWYRYFRTVKNLEYKDLSVQDPYEAGARATGGQVLKFDKQKMGPDQVALMIATALQSLKEKDYALLWRAEGVSGYSATEFPFEVDDSISELSVFVSGISSRPEFQLFDPKKLRVKADSNLTADNSSTEIFQRPAPGPWQLRILKSDNISVYIRAKTDVSLVNLGPVRPGGRLGHEGLFSYKGPLRPGSTQGFLANVSSSNRPFTSGSFELRSLDGRRLNTVEAKNDDAGDLTGEIKVPNEPFRIVVSWTNSQGQIFRRMEEKTFELNLLEKVEFKYQREEPEDSSVCKAASYLGVYVDANANSTMLFMCSKNDFSGKMRLYSQIGFSLPLDPEAKLKTFRFLTPDYQKLTQDDCQMAAKSFASFPKTIRANDGQTIEFTFACQGGPTDFKGVIEAKAL